MPQSKERIKELRADPEWLRKYRYYHRRYRVMRILKDPEYGKIEARRAKEWKIEKLKRCPEYKLYLQVSNRVSKLRTKLEFHQKIADRTEKRLLAAVARYQKLSDFCRGK